MVVKVGTDGNVCLFNSNPTHLVGDVNGFFSAFPDRSAAPPRIVAVACDEDLADRIREPVSDDPAITDATVAVMVRSPSERVRSYRIQSPRAKGVMRDHHVPISG
ncbi:MAG TPA: hypothetical protein VHN36_20095 [Ilumatobacteraceae bacterium]|nr:hypothetical protein [Ilumatobacteraceae bacterium]